MHEDHYEEQLDWNLHKLLPVGQRIEKVSAYKISKPRFIGDLGLRAFFQLRKKAIEIITNEKIDFVYIPIPSFYCSLIGPYLFKKTGVKYGIDYIDPWVHVFPGSNKLFSRHWFSTQLSKFLEPRAVKYASLITAVAEAYYTHVQQRNPNLMKHCIFGAMPYGGEYTDFEAVRKLALKPYLFNQNSKTQFVYAGAMLPKAYAPLEAVFKAIQSNRSTFEEVEFHFIGTGSKSSDPESFTIKTLAQKYDLWQEIVFEYPQRFPYLDVLSHLEAADGVFILGSTEQHYSPSKFFQAVLSGKYIFAILNQMSEAVQFIVDSNTGIVLDFNGEEGIVKIEKEFVKFYKEWKIRNEEYKIENHNQPSFNHYKAEYFTERLANLINHALSL